MAKGTKILVGEKEAALVFHEDERISVYVPKMKDDTEVGEGPMLTAIMIAVCMKFPEVREFLSQKFDEVMDKVNNEEVIPEEGN